ncbi:retrovirus-related pol polyprotein from transposon TNT 1-94, partial [Tanacetum coccineum]
TMADVNVNAPAEQAPAMSPPIRTDDQIPPCIRWHTNFFRAFIASSIIPSIYIQQFWDTVRYDNKTRSYSCQLDEQWFDLTKDTLRDGLQITPVDTNNAFSSPPTPDALIKFVNDLGYPRVYKFHPRPGSPLHLPNKEPVLGYLKFSAKGTKREVFGMPIPNDLITNDIRGEQYYNAYLEKVAKHQRYLASEEVSDLDSPAPKPAKATKPKASKQSKPLAPKAATKKPKPAPAKPQEKKRKLVTKTSEAPSPAKRSKAGKVVKKRTKKSSPQLLDEFVNEGVPENEPRIGDEEADLQKAVEESLKEVHSARQGPLPPVVIREPESGKFQPLPEVQGKSKEKVSDEHVALDLLTLQTPKKKSPADYETDSDEEVPGIVARVQAEGQAGPNPGEHDEGQARPNLGDAAASQPPSSHVNLKLPTEGEVRLEEPTSSAGTLSSLQHLDKELSFANQFLVEKSQEDKPEKTNTELEVQSMVIIPIHQDTSSVPLMTTPVIDLTVSQPVPTAVQAPLPTLTATATATTTTTTLPPVPP